MTLEHLKDVAKDLGKLAKNIVVDTAKFSVVVLPWYAGIASHVNDTKFFEEAYESLPLALGILIGAAGIRGIQYLKRNPQNK